MAITVPPVRGAGDLGHVDDSNVVRQALLDLDAQKVASSTVTSLVVLTAADYASITPDPATLYVVVG